MRVCERGGQLRMAQHLLDDEWGVIADLKERRTNCSAVQRDPDRVHKEETRVRPLLTSGRSLPTSQCYVSDNRLIDGFRHRQVAG